MQSFLRVFSISVFILSLSLELSNADTFILPKPQVKHASISPLTPFDEALRKEMQKYPKDSAFFVDGRTGKILSVNKLPDKESIIKPTPKPQPRITQESKKSVPKIPYEMQEERIELLQ